MFHHQTCTSMVFPARMSAKLFHVKTVAPAHSPALTFRSRGPRALGGPTIDGGFDALQVEGEELLDVSLDQPRDPQHRVACFASPVRPPLRCEVCSTSCTCQQTDGVLDCVQVYDSGQGVRVGVGAGSDRRSDGCSSVSVVDAGTVAWVCSARRAMLEGVRRGSMYRYRRERRA